MRLALEPICAELRQAGFAQVEGVLEFSSQADEPRALPALWVVPVSETPTGNTQDVGRQQAVDVAFSVFVAIAAGRRHRAGVAEDVQTETGRVVDVLTGWTHPEAARACSYAGGRLASAAGSVVVWEVRFKTRWHLRKAS